MSLRESRIIGETLRVKGVCKVDNVATDPDFISATIYGPAGIVQAATVESGEGEGQFSAHYTPSPSDPIGNWTLYVKAVFGVDTEIEATRFLVSKGRA